MANYSCKETCGQEKPCGNRYCSANPKYVPPAPKKKGKKVTETVGCGEGCGSCTNSACGGKIFPAGNEKE